MIRRRLLMLILVVLGFWGAIATGCVSQSGTGGRLVVGIISYDSGAKAIERYEPFRQYLSEATHSVVELEPVFNEIKAIEQIRRQVWSIAFAPPGLAAIAMTEAQYVPVFPLEAGQNLHSVIVVRADSPVQTVGELAHQVVALGEPGSAAGYYLPLYDLYGMTLSEIRFAPTPRTVLQWLDEGAIAAGALGEDEFQQYRGEFGSANFRVLHRGRVIPPGSVLISPRVERNQQQYIESAMQAASSRVTTDAGYLPQAPLPNYDSLTELIKRVQPLEAKIRQKPAILTAD
jgi:phosphonate transport system substrate-binding protein